jgi:cytochrome c peroxidase
VGVENEVPQEVGRFAFKKKQRDQGEFRTPCLRNVAVTAPYLHDGSLKTLKKLQS